MERPALLVSTCGTSLWTNHVRRLPESRRQAAEALVRSTANHTESSLSPENRQSLAALGAEVQAALRAAAPEQAKQASAELNGILACERELGGNPGRHHSILLASDTYQGQFAAAALRDWLVAQGRVAEVKVLTDLQTGDRQRFEWGCSDLVRWCLEVVQDWRASHRVVFHATGGFKALQSYVAALGMVVADEVVNLFESGELLRLPSLPFAMQFEPVVREHLGVVRRLVVCGKVPAGQVPNALAACVVALEGEAMLSALGQLAWKQCQEGIYREQFWGSPYDRVRYGSGFEASVAQHGQGRYDALNERIDDLAGFVYSGRRRARLDLKPLRGAGVPGSSHELDAWADGAAKRIFLHQEGEVWVLDRLGPALH